MAEDREARIRERAHRLWEEEGRPEGRAEEHWRRAQVEVDGKGQAAGDALPAPDDAQAEGISGSPPADPLRNPEPFPPAQDPMYPAVTGPEEVPPIEGARDSLNPEEIVEPKRATRAPRVAERAKASANRRTGSAEVKTRRRPGNVSPDE
jgi:hypothetical protein